MQSTPKNAIVDRRKGSVAMKNGKRSAVATCLAVTAFACFHPLAVQAIQEPQLAESVREIQNLRAFAKVYGYVKYFHPSDEASDTDWDKFAVLGVRTVKTAMDQMELETRLSELFLPIAPTMRFYRSERKPADPILNPPKGANSLQTVSWQHVGIQLVRPDYESKRVYVKIKPGASDQDESSKLFDKIPAIGEFIDEEIGPSLHCQIPLALYCDQEVTIGSVHLWLSSKETKRFNEEPSCSRRGWNDHTLAHPTRRNRI
jgi:hypothetical protein